MRESVSLSKVEASLAPALRTAAGDANGAAVRINDCEEVAFVIIAGAWTDGAHTAQPQYATDDPASPGSPLAASWADIPAADLIGDVPVLGETDENGVFQLGFKKYGDWEHVRIRHEITGGSTGMIVGGLVRKTGLRFAGVHPDGSAVTHDGRHAE